MSGKYAHPDVLVTTDWVSDHLKDPNVRIVESDEDVLLYHQGHIPGAVKIDWHADLQDEAMSDRHRSRMQEMSGVVLSPLKGIIGDYRKEAEKHTEHEGHKRTPNEKQVN